MEYPGLKVVVKKDRIIISGDEIMTTEKIGGNLAENLKKFFVNFLNSRSGSEIQSFLEDEIAKEMFFAYFDTEFEMIMKDGGGDVHRGIATQQETEHKYEYDPPLNPMTRPLLRKFR